MAWYRQYRPQRVQDLHIAPVRDQLQKILDGGQFAHAYLFAGPKGTGKTSSARILARVLNEPENQQAIQSGKGKFSEPSSNDPVLAKIAEGRSQVVIEQDAASHRGIDDVRQLQEHISVVPTEGFIRVVILDEVHMLTNEAFNALLKMLEEPPENVVFVLATTELHKVPATVQSRCQLVRFRQATKDEIESVVRSIAEKEKIDITDEVVARLATVAAGSFRDAVKYFEQIVSNGAIDESVVQAVLGSDKQVTELLRSLAKKDVAAVSEYFAEARQLGTSFRSLEQALLNALQERLSRAIQRKEPKNTLMNIVDLLEHFSSRLGGPEPVEGIALEVACLRWCLGETAVVESTESPQTGAKKTPPQSKTATMACAKDEVSREKVVVHEDAEKEVSQPEQNQNVERKKIEDQWAGILLAVREESTAVESLLRNTELGEVVGDTVKIIVSLRFHLERLQTKKYAHIVQDVLRKRLHNDNVEVEYILLEQPEEEIIDTSANQDDQMLAAVEEALLSAEG